MLVCIGTATHAQSMFKCRLADGSYSYQAERCPESASQQTITANSRGAIKIAPAEVSGAKRWEKSSSQPVTPTAPLARELAATTGAESLRAPTQQTSIPGPDLNTSASTQKEPTSKVKQGFLILLIAVFGLLSIFGLVGLYVAAFRESVGWGMLCLFVPFAMLVFVIRHWEQAKVPFLLSISVPVFGIALAVYMGKNGQSANKGQHYVLNGGEVYDATTKLTWKRCSVGQQWMEMPNGHCDGGASRYVFDAAQSQAVTGWRVPTVNELATLVEHAPDSALLIDVNAFPDVREENASYWSSSYANTELAWAVQYSKTGPQNQQSGARAADRSLFYRVRLVHQ